MSKRNVKDDGKWYVVLFSKNQCDAVPDFWLREDGTKVLWPPKSNSMQSLISLISNRKKPQKDWTQCQLEKVLWDTGVDSYDKAVEKVSIYQQTSDVETEFKKMQNKSLRKDRTKKRLPSDEEAPTGKSIPPKRFKGNKTKNLSNINECKLPSLSDMLSDPIIETHKESTSSKSRKFQNDGVKLQIVKNKKNETSSSKKASLSKNTINIPPNYQSKENDDTKVLFEHINQINERIDYIAELLKSLIEHTSNFNGVRNDTSENDIESVMKLKSILPLTTMNTFNHSEKLLSKDNTYRNNMKKYLMSVGGKTVRKEIRNMLKETISNELGSLFSGKGNKGKEDFQATEMYSLITEVVLEQHKKFKKSSIFQVASDWLKHRPFQKPKEEKKQAQNLKNRHDQKNCDSASSSDSDEANLSDESQETD